MSQRIQIYDYLKLIYILVNIFVDNNAVEASGKIWLNLCSDFDVVVASLCVLLFG